MWISFAVQQAKFPVRVFINSMQVFPTQPLNQISVKETHRENIFD